MGKWLERNLIPIAFIAIIALGCLLKMTSNLEKEAPPSWPTAEVWADKPIPAGAENLVPVWVLGHTIDELHDAGMDWVSAQYEYKDQLARNFSIYWYVEQVPSHRYLVQFKDDRVTCISVPYPGIFPHPRRKPLLAP